MTALPPSATSAIPTTEQSAVVAVWLDTRDDVATALRAIEPGERVRVRCGDEQRGVAVREAIPPDTRSPCTRWSAARASASTVSSSELSRPMSPKAPGSTRTTLRPPRIAPRLTSSTSAWTGPPALRGHDVTQLTFQGYRRPDGRAGTRNHVLVLSATGLTSAAAQRICQLVRGTICVATGYGRGQVGADAKLQIATLSGSPRIPTSPRCSWSRRRTTSRRSMSRPPAPRASRSVGAIATGGARGRIGARRYGRTHRDAPRARGVAIAARDLRRKPSSWWRWSAATPMPRRASSAIRSQAA